MGKHVGILVFSGLLVFALASPLVAQPAQTGFGFNAINDLVIRGVDAFSSARTGSFQNTYAYPLFANSTYSVTAQGNLSLFAHVRQGGQVRVEAPGFSPQSATGNPFAAMMTGLGSQNGSSSSAPDDIKLPEMDGTFRIVTDGRVLANNTDEGPKAGPGGQVLEWRINKRTQTAPMALVQLGS